MCVCIVPTSYSENAQVEKPATGKFYVCTWPHEKRSFASFFSFAFFFCTNERH